MNELRPVTDDRAAVALADRLNGTGRTRPIVVVTSPAGRSRPYIDAEEIVREVGDLADVYLLATGPHTWTFSDNMPANTQVYGGAGRVYPLGHEWVSNPLASPLRFAYSAEEGHRATRALISDALHMAAAAGLVKVASSDHRVQVEGTVVGFPVPERAWVKFDGRLAQIAEELTLSTVPLERVVAVGMQVRGWFDAQTGRLDVSDTLLPAEVALHSYQPGDVVLAQVATVQADRAELLLHPSVRVSVARQEVTGNDLDDLRSLMTPGEVLPARVVASGPSWALTLLDVDDDEEPVPAASLIAGGPPWIVVAPASPTTPEWSELETESLATPPARATVEMALTTPEAGVDTPDPAPATTTRPTPAILDKRRESASPAQTPAGATASMALTIDTLRGKVRSLERELVRANEELRAGSAERATLVLMRQEREQHLARLEHELQVQRAQLRKAKKPATAVKQQSPEFADPEQAFRYAVLTAWAMRTPVGEQSSRPLPDYDLGPHFLDSLAEVPGIALDKVAQVVVEILTGRAQQVAGRELHQLRESAVGSAPQVRRSADNATCWRAALQVNAPQARRIHYWMIPGGRIEFSRVALHDDFRP